MPYVHVASHLVDSDKEHDVWQTYHLMDEVMSQVQPVTPGWPVGKALDGSQDLDTASVDDVLAVDATLKGGWKDVAATTARLPTLTRHQGGGPESAMAMMTRIFYRRSPSCPRRLRP